MLRINHPQYEVSLRRARPRATYAFLLHGIVGLANPRRVDHRHRIAVEIELHLDDVARGAGMRRDDRDLAPRQLIHQRRLADVRGTRDRNHQPLAQPLTSPLCRKHFLDLTEQHFDFCQRRRQQFSGHVTFVGEIDPGFDQRRGLDDLRAPVAGSVAEQTFQLTQRLAALPIGVGVNQIVEAFRLGEIKLAVLERAPGEFARLRSTYIRETRERREQCREHRAPAMDVKFRDVLAGRARGCRKPQHHGIVDRLPLRIPQQRPRRHPRHRNPARERGQRRPGLRPGYPHNGNGAWRPARR